MAADYESDVTVIVGELHLTCTDAQKYVVNFGATWDTCNICSQSAFFIVDRIAIVQCLAS